MKLILLGKKTEAQKVWVIDQSPASKQKQLSNPGFWPSWFSLEELKVLSVLKHVTYLREHSIAIAYPHSRHTVCFNIHSQYSQGFLGGSVGKESACSAQDLGSVPRSGRFPAEGNVCTLQWHLAGYRPWNHKDRLTLSQYNQGSEETCLALFNTTFSKFTLPGTLLHGIPTKSQTGEIFY